MTIEPRTVAVRIISVGLFRMRHLRSFTPVPTPLQICREARNQTSYRKLFSELETHPDVERRYVWLSLDIDIVDVGTRYFSDYAKVGASIKRLKMERANKSEHFYGFESPKLDMWFANVRKLHVVCMDGFVTLAGALEEGHHR
jgi:hypothetical protein